MVISLIGWTLQVAAPQAVIEPGKERFPALIDRTVGGNIRPVRPGRIACQLNHRIDLTQRPRIEELQRDSFLNEDATQAVRLQFMFDRVVTAKDLWRLGDIETGDILNMMSPFVEMTISQAACPRCSITSSRAFGL